MKRILVTAVGTDAGRSFIAAARLVEEPVFVIGADSNAFQLACADLDASYLVPPAVDPTFRDRLLGIVSDERVTFVHAQSDPDVAGLSECREDLPGLLFLPDHADVVAAQNRMHCNRLLAAAGIPVPGLIRLHDRIDIDSELCEVSDRSGRAWIRPVHVSAPLRSIRVATVAQATAWIRYCVEMGGADATDFVLSSWLPGREFVFQGVWTDGALLTSATVERMDAGSDLPIGSGAAVARTVRRDDVNDIASKAVRALSPRPSGPFSVTLREDESGLPHVTDVTAGRFRTLVHFAAAAGSNLVHTYLRLAYGMAIPGMVRFDAAEEDLYWVRSMDRKPHLFKGAPWIQRRAA